MGIAPWAAGHKGTASPPEQKLAGGDRREPPEHAAGKMEAPRADQGCLVGPTGLRSSRTVHRGLASPANISAALRALNPPPPKGPDRTRYSSKTGKVAMSQGQTALA